MFSFRSFVLSACFAACFGLAQHSPAAPVAVVYDGAGADAKFSRSRAVNVQRLLAAAGLESSLGPVQEISKSLAADTVVVHAVWVSKLPVQADTAFKSFVACGGKIVVHGSFSVELASIMGLAAPAVDYQEPGAGASAWTGYELPAPRPLDAPERIDNRVIKVAKTASAAAGTRPIAFWRDDAGRRGPAALWRCDAGYWIVRPLYDDGPSAPKVRLVGALTCALSPPLWKTSALALRKAAWSRGTRTQWIKAAPREARSRVEALAAAAEREDSAAAALFARGLYGAAHSNLWNLAAAASLANAAAHPVRKRGKILAAWEPTGFGGVPGGWAEAAPLLQRAGVTDVYVWCGSLAASVATLPGIPAAPQRTGRADPLVSALRECHKRGIKVHAWFAALSFEHAPAARHAAFENAGRLLLAPNGKAVDWLDPASPANARDVAAALSSLAKLGVDGINLDFIRYPGASIPTRDKPDPAKIEAFLAAVRRGLRASSPKTPLSACVYGGYPGCISSCGQDWYAWLAKGLVDQAVPMNYCPDAASLRKLVDAQRRRRGSVVCGIGAGSNEARLDAAGLLEQLSIAFGAGYAGAAIYPFDARFAEEFVPALREALK